MTEQVANDAEEVDAFYPGSKRRRAANTDGAPSTVTSGWDVKPLFLTVEGVEVEFFNIGALAKALGRRSSTLRKWETLGILPKARFHTPGANRHGQFRLYTRTDVETIARIAHEEGLIGTNRQVQCTAFSERVGRYWDETNVA